MTTAADLSGRHIGHRVRINLVSWHSTDGTLASVRHYASHNQTGAVLFLAEHAEPLHVLPDTPVVVETEEAA